MNSAIVSIVIVNWKTPDLLSWCLDSISANCSLDKCEIWVVDNASYDGSVDMLSERYPFVHLIANTKNIGFPRACNQAIKKATGQYILLLNPDTLVVDDAIFKMANFMEANPDCGAVGPKVLNPDGTLQLACRRSFPDPLAAFFRVTYLSRLFPNNEVLAKYNMTYTDPNALTEVDALSGSCMMVAKSVIDKVGMLDEDWFMYGEEIDWCWRIKQAGYKIFYIPDAIVYHYHGGASRLRPLKAIIDLHHGLTLFYRKHLAQKYWMLFNLVVYAAIWLRATVLVVLSWLSQVLGLNQDHLDKSPNQEFEQLRLHITGKYKHQ